MDDPPYQGFHTYATSDLYDTNGGQERWPDNWSATAPDDSSDDTDEEDDEPASKRDYWMALLWTLIWFAIPLIVLVLRAVTQSGETSSVCESGLGACSSPRGQALADLIDNSPVWLVALGAALGLSVVLRWASDSWRAMTIGFCASVVAGGAITVLYHIW